jgi:hypothetical protein
MLLQLRWEDTGWDFFCTAAPLPEPDFMQKGANFTYNEYANRIFDIQGRGRIVIMRKDLTMKT